MAEYRKRVADGILMEKLEATGAMIVEGPKWCGKTTTAERVDKIVIYMAEPKKRERNLLYARLEPEKILDGDCPRLVDELPTFGLLFETLVMRDLRVYAAVPHGEVKHYRDKNGLECDAVIHLRDGRYGLVEVKMGGEALVDEGARVLNELAALIDTKRMKKPSFKMVVTAVGDCAYAREDGVLVCPIGSLRP